MGLKSMVKAPAARWCAMAGRAGMWDWCNGFMMRHVVPRLMDKDIIPPVMTSVPLRRMGISIICHPYAAHHISAFWTGRLVERSLDRLLRQLLAPGDTFLDIGANLGHITCLAAALVGPEGKVHAVEAHPWLAAALREYVQKQGANHVEVHGVALSDSPGEMALKVCASNIGANSLRDNVNGEKLRAHDDSIGYQMMDYAARAAGMNAQQYPSEVAVQVVRADDLFAGLTPRGQVYAKIDVEGFEIHVLEGMPRLLRDVLSALVVEITPEWIGGPDGVQRIFSVMGAAGFAPYLLDLHNSQRSATPAAVQDLTQQHNVLFAKVSAARRLKLEWVPPQT